MGKLADPDSFSSNTIEMKNRYEEKTILPRIMICDFTNRNEATRSVAIPGSQHSCAAFPIKMHTGRFHKR